MAVTLYNTLSRNKEKFTPQIGTTVRLYTCGPTVYKSQHIGNYRTFIFEDILKRTLMLNGLDVNHIMNITDVGHLVSDADDGEDKVAKEAARQGKSAIEVASHFETEFKEDIEALNILPPKQFTRATEHIQEQIDLIQNLEKKGVTYKTSDGIYFDTSKIQNYGRLAPHDVNASDAGHRIEMGEKKNPTDFALWKFSPKDEKRDMEWDSPWGIGFPGWHIECSAMAMKYLGETLDIHCGGIDHAEIHHPNEMAQSETATGQPFARFWCHAEFLTFRDIKMAKSSPDTNITIATLREKGFDPLDYRYFTLGTHYRKKLSFSWEALKGARNARLNMLALFRKMPEAKSKSDETHKEDVKKALNDDLNMPLALAHVWGALKNSASQDFVLWADHILGLRVKKESTIPSNIDKLAQTREEYRATKDFKKSDEVRDELKKLGFGIEDTEHGPVVHKI
ncbi:MAG: cysteine--tRNA ligase [bacterium]|nr:cysteine--tRNA ligase [bacterium]